MLVAGRMRKAASAARWPGIGTGSGIGTGTGDAGVTVVMGTLDLDCSARTAAGPDRVVMPQA